MDGGVGLHHGRINTGENWWCTHRKIQIALPSLCLPICYFQYHNVAQPIPLLNAPYPMIITAKLEEQMGAFPSNNRCTPRVTHTSAVCTNNTNGCARNFHVWILHTELHVIHDGDDFPTSPTSRLASLDDWQLNQWLWLLSLMDCLEFLHWQSCHPQDEILIFGDSLIFHRAVTLVYDKISKNEWHSASVVLCFSADW